MSELPKEVVDKLFRLYIQYWYETSTYDIKSTNLIGLGKDDEEKLNTASEAIELHETMIREYLGT